MSRFNVHFKSFTFNFTNVEVKKVRMPHRMDLTSLKKLSQLKNAINVKLA